MRRIRRKIGALLLAACLFLGGCGAERVGEDASEGTSSTGQETEITQSETQLNVKAVKSIHFEKPEEGYGAGNTRYVTRGGKVYLLRVEYPEDEALGTEGEWRLCMQIYDSGKEKVEKRVLSPRVPGYEGYTIRSVGLTPEGELSFRMTEAEGERESSLLVRTDLQGEVLEVVEPFPNEEDYPWNADVWSDREVFCLTDGRMILSRWDENTRTAVLTWFGGENAGELPGKLEEDVPVAFCCDEEGMLYCLAGDRLIRWDLEKGIGEEMFRLYENGISSGGASGLIRTGEGELLLCRMSEGEAYAYVLTDKEIEYDSRIRIACVARPIGIDYIRGRASVFARDTGSISVTLETEDEKYQEDYRNRIFAELAAGKGPELLWLERDDLLLLAEKGILYDMSDMIPEELRGELIHGALEVGTVDGKLVGFTPQVEFSTLFTCDQVWAEDGWTPADVVKLVDEREDWKRLIFGNEFSILYNLFLWDTANSPFLDLERGVCDFKNEEFIHILELCKKYAKSSAQGSYDREELTEQLKAGECVAVHESIYSMIDFSVEMENYGEDCHTVGYPVEKGSGNYVYPYSYCYLAVNAEAEHKEEIGRFITYLLEYDNQLTVDGCSVRKDVLRNNVVYVDDSRYTIYHLDKDPLVKPAGITYLEEFFDLIESCEPPQAVLPQAIRSIMGEELPGYFQGSKSAEEVTEVIQRRVQLYLDERE